ncbi:type IV pilus twitching motility protein PilT [Serpentinicella sp. ANB-PHB4]|uniref:type IV pilus twitching motility protein PilT n=1 Tax=Serpentinicella sp. ANB-PHB4 TaxID=3074076 RepID=UPI00285D3824|nr:type IV pilus twitching motility protein PilT [Serpentinicella sp. ANB-PHB4]MDR5658121.1 type IV pilus twitching motility protein PilT [Serpentinicella sp. ANB-PHB4]
MNAIALLEKTLNAGASDLHITVGVPPVIRINGDLERLKENALLPKDTEDLVKQLLNHQQFKELNENGELDLSYSLSSLGRFRINMYKQRGSYGMAVRVVAGKIPSFEELKLPDSVKDLARKRRGLILVTGPTGSGKSTTLAAMIDLINKERSGHILTLEDPIEYLHKHNKSIVNQREIGHDSKNFTNALRASLRQDPEVILVGEMRDLETISIAITAAETGHLVLSTLHTLGAAKTIDRVIDVFPPYQQQQIRVQLASVIEGVISQQLIPTADGENRIGAFEVMIATTAIKNMIREGKTHQVANAIATGSKYGMQTMDNVLLKYYRNAIITRKTFLSQATDKEFALKYGGY